MDLHGPLRLFRAVLVTGMATSLAAAGHLLGGGALPGLGIAAALAALLLAPVAWLPRRQLSFLALLGVLGSGQLILHQAFASPSSPALCLPSSAEQVTHHGPAVGVGCSAAVTASMPVHIGTGADSPLMLAGHLLALLVTAWVLRKGRLPCGNSLPGFARPCGCPGPPPSFLSALGPWPRAGSWCPCPGGTCTRTAFAARRRGRLRGQRMVALDRRLDQRNPLEHRPPSTTCTGSQERRSRHGRLPSPQPERAPLARGGPCRAGPPLVCPSCPSAARLSRRPCFRLRRRCGGKLRDRQQTPCQLCYSRVTC
jgi:hypothetical protein